MAETKGIDQQDCLSQYSLERGIRNTYTMMSMASRREHAEEVNTEPDGRDEQKLRGVHLRRINAEG
jgi:hypothetical protein